MAWFKIDDGFPDHDKARMAGLLGRALWADAGARSAKIRSDGVVAAHRVDEYLFLSGVRGRKEGGHTAPQLLVAAGLWHDATTIGDCDRCNRLTGGLEAGAFYFHDWVDYQPTREDNETPEKKAIARRKKALHRDDHLRDLIFTRDRGRCRYCGIQVDVNPQNKRGRDGLTYDHVDPGCFTPNGGNFPEGVVVACRGCNSSKKNRTPADAGMELLPVPGPSAGEIDHQAATSRPEAPAPPPPAPEPPVAGQAADGAATAAEEPNTEPITGPEPAGSGSDPGHDPRGDGPGRAGSGSGSGSVPGPVPGPGRRGSGGTRAGAGAPTPSQDEPP